jgi:hypothetical protein
MGARNRGSFSVLVDFLDQFFDGAKRPAAKGLLCNSIEPKLHLMQLRGIGRSEVHMES